MSEDRTSYALYRVYRHAKAAWEIILYDPAYSDEDVPDEINDPLSERHANALNDFLLHPVDTSVDLSRKMHAFRDEQIAKGWYRAGEIVDVLAEDARRVCLAEPRQAA